MAETDIPVCSAKQDLTILLLNQKNITNLIPVYLAHITLDGLRTHSYYHPLVGAESVESVGVVIGIALAIPSEVAMQCGVGASIHDEYVGIGFASLGSHD